MHAARPDGDDGGVVWRELTVLLESLAEDMKSVADQVCQTAYAREHIHVNFSQRKHGDTYSRQWTRAWRELVQVWAGVVTVQPDEKDSNAGRISAYSPGPRIRGVNFAAGTEGGRDTMHTVGDGDTGRLTGMGGSNIILDTMACGA